MSNQKDIHALMIKYLDCSANEDEKKQLADRLREPSEESRDAWRILEVHFQLNLLLGPGAGARGSTTPLLAEETFESNMCSTPSPLPFPRERSSWWKPLAAAASLLAVAGIWILLTLSESATDIHVVSTHGNPDQNGDEWQTGHNASVHLQYTDGSEVFVGPNTRAVVNYNETGGILIRQMEGDLFVHMANQDKVPLIQAGSANLHVRGTRFLSRIDNGNFSEGWLTEGALGVETEQASVVIRPGQKVVSIGTDKNGLFPFLHVSPFQSADIAALPLDWMKTLGLEPSAITATDAMVFEPFATTTINFDDYFVALGLWTIMRRSDSVIVHKENTGKGMILFGDPEWQQGHISCQFRMPSKSPQPTSLEIGFYYSSPYAMSSAGHEKNQKNHQQTPESLWPVDVFDFIGVSLDSMASLSELAGKWYQMEVSFSLENNTTFIKDFSLWPSNNPGSRNELIKPGQQIVCSPESSAILHRDRAGIALRVNGSAIEIKDLKVKGEL